MADRFCAHGKSLAGGCEQCTLAIIEGEIDDWFTIAPTYRTRDRLIEMVRASLKFMEREK